MTPRDPVESAREVLRAEGAALSKAADALDARFGDLVERIEKTEGKVVLTGVGKSGIIGQKIAATLASTGTPAMALHAVEAVMGDLGMLSSNDLLIAISNSGETNEVVNVVLAAKQIGASAVAWTRNPESSLALECELVVPLVFEKEAGHLGLAPTTSSTLTLALGDALAVSLMERRDFSKDDFARYHPGGALGRRLALRVEQVMRTGEDTPRVTASDTIETALASMGEYGATLVVDDNEDVVGIFTDGDLRRAIERGHRRTDPVSTSMTEKPQTVEADVKAAEALRIMEVRAITLLPVVDASGRTAGVVHIHDLLGRAQFEL